MSAHALRRLILTLALVVFPALAPHHSPAADVLVIGSDGTPGADGVYVPGNSSMWHGGVGGAGGAATALADGPGAINIATARGGIGGPGGNGAPFPYGDGRTGGGNGGTGGAGGLANATAITTAGALPATAIARTNDLAGSGRGGVGGSAPGDVADFTGLDGQGGVGSAATVSATATNTSSAPVFVEATARGGDGGLGGLGTNLGPGNGGNGGGASLGTVYGGSTGGGTVTVLGSVIGGNGGGTPIFALPSTTPDLYPLGVNGDGASVTLANKVDGDTTGTLTLVQVAQGGDSGTGMMLNGGAGSATSTLNLTRSAQSFNAATFAVGGNGGTWSSSVAPYVERVGDAIAATTVTNNAGSVSATAHATGGQGSDEELTPVYFQYRGPSRGGNATASGSATVAASGGSHATSLDIAAVGGNGGDSTLNSTNNGGAASVPTATVSNASAGPSVLTIRATGGNGGNGGALTSGALGGNATVGPVSAQGTDGGPVTVDIDALGGQGGNNAQGGKGGAVSISNITATGGGSAPVNVDINAVGGAGGVSTGSNLAVGGSVTLGNVSASSSGNGPVLVRSYVATGMPGTGAAGTVYNGAPTITSGVLQGTSNGGAVDVDATFRGSDGIGNAGLFSSTGSDVSVASRVDGATSGSLTLSQTAIAGHAAMAASSSGGWRDGGSAGSGLIVSKTATVLTLNATAIGGNGSNNASASGFLGNGGAASVNINGTNAGAITTNAVAIGGNAGRTLSGSGPLSAASGVGTVDVRATSTGDNHPATANALLRWGESQADAPLPGITSNRTFSRAETFGASSNATSDSIVQLPLQLINRPVVTDVQAYSRVHRNNGVAESTANRVFTGGTNRTLTQASVSGGDGGATIAGVLDLTPMSLIFENYEIAAGIPSNVSTAQSAAAYKPPTADATAAAAGNPLLASAGFGTISLLASAATYIHGSSATGFAAGRTYSASTTFTVPASQIASTNHLQLGLAKNAIAAAGVDSLHLTVTRDGATVVDRTFTTASSVQAFFADRLLDLGAAPASPTANPVTIDVNIEAVNRGAGDSFKSFFLLGNLPAPKQHLAVSSLEGRQVSLVDAAGGTSTLADATDGLLAPLGLARTGANSLQVSDFLLSKVWNVTAGGAVTTQAGPVQGIASPVGLTDGGGGTLAADYLAGVVRSIDVQGQTAVVAGAAQGVTRPFDVAVDSLGNTFVVDIDGRRVVKVTPQGQGSVFADAADGLFAPVGVAIDAANNVFVSDALTSRITRFDTAGLGSTFADAADGLIAPTGLTFDPFGYLFVANYLGNNIQRFDTAGRGAVFADYYRPWDVASLGTGWGVGAAPVPEPSAAGLFLIGVAAILWRRRARNA